MALSSVSVFFAYAAAALLPLALVPTMAANLDSPGGKGVLVLLVGTTCWSLGTGVNAVATTPGLTFVASNVGLLGASFAGIGSFLAIAEYTGAVQVTRQALAVFAIEPVLKQILAWTNPLHTLIYVADIPALSTTDALSNYTTLVWVDIVALYLLTVFGLLLAANEVLTSRGVRRQQALALLGAVVPPTTASILAVTNVTIRD